MPNLNSKSHLSERLFLGHNFSMLKNLLTGPVKPNETLSQLSLLALRVFVGGAMAFGHGLGKVPPSEKFIEGVTEMGFPMPLLFAWSAGLAEFVGGIFLALGLFTRPSAFFVAFTMGVAAFVRHAPDPFKQKELSLLYFVIAIFFVIHGAGKFSADRFIRK